MEPLKPQSDADIFSVSQLNRQVKSLLEDEFPLLWVEGEISNLTRHSSGHWYFSLKDEQAQVACAMFRGQNKRLNFIPEAGNQVLVQAKVSLYAPRGNYQLIVEAMEEAGFGALQRAFEALKKKLDQEGLFNPIHKKPIPTLPKCIGVITSTTGAAIRDVLSTLKRRFPSIPVIIYPTMVQGKAAAANIVQALQRANEQTLCDVLLLCRGGGSLEDLWCFNEETVARAMYASHIPIISGVGHEIDITIADFVADQRAATPTAAAELCCPHQQDWLNALQQIEQRLLHLIQQQCQHWQQKIQWLLKRLQHPGQRLQELAQRLDRTEQQLFVAMEHYVTRLQHRIAQCYQQMLRCHPQHRLDDYRHAQQLLQQQLVNTMQKKLTHYRHCLQQLAHALDNISPLGTLARGYAIVKRRSDDKILQQAQDVRVGDKITAQLHKGEINCHVESINL